jgi:sugar/nucleoside kinase (ribokinase family)
MLNASPLESVDYLVLGHITNDLLPNGNQIGGTASYAALTARMLGKQVGIVTAVGDENPLALFDGIQLRGMEAERSTTFENISTPEGRAQFVHHISPTIQPFHVPELWRNTPIVHFGPLVDELDFSLLRLFPDALKIVTPQGWLRDWDRNGQVRPSEWPDATFVLANMDAAILSIDDVGHDWSRIDEFAYACPILVVTRGERGARVYVAGDTYDALPPEQTEFDAVGAGDIFATAFGIHLHTTKDPVAALTFATHLASYSVTRAGLDSIPTRDEIYRSLDAAEAYLQPEDIF